MDEKIAMESQSLRTTQIRCTQVVPPCNPIDSDKLMSYSVFKSDFDGGICPDMAKLTPYFYSDNAREQAAFYVSALGGELQQHMTYGDVPGTDGAIKDRIIHMSFTAGGVSFYIADTMHEPPGRGHGLDLSLEFATDEQAQEAFAKLSQGGTVIMALEKQFWGSLFGRLQDKYGIKWQVTTAVQ